jgi:hypothetical protein
VGKIVGLARSNAFKWLIEAKIYRDGESLQLHRLKEVTDGNSLISSRNQGVAAFRKGDRRGVRYIFISPHKSKVFVHVKCELPKKP